MSKTILLGEVPFSSLQGEGLYTGKNTIWVRLFYCNLQCDGFGQDDPTDKSSYILPYKDLDLTGISRLEDLPIWTRGCDSSWSWSKKYKHLVPKYSATSLVDELEGLLSGTKGNFVTYIDGRYMSNRHLCFTGDESLMKRSQGHTISILKDVEIRNNLLLNITIETNATQPLTQNFINAVEYYSRNYGIEFLADVS